MTYEVKILYINIKFYVSATQGCAKSGLLLLRPVFLDCKGGLKKRTPLTFVSKGTNWFPTQTA